MTGRADRLSVIVRPMACALLLSLDACQTMASSPSQASVDLGDPATHAAVTAALSAALGRGHIELGPVNDAETSVVSVLPLHPGPYETNSTAMPVRFDIAKRDGRCVAIRHDTGEVFDLPGVSCR